MWVSKTSLRKVIWLIHATEVRPNAIFVKLFKTKVENVGSLEVTHLFKVPHLVNIENPSTIEGEIKCEAFYNVFGFRSSSDLKFSDISDQNYFYCLVLTRALWSHDTIFGEKLMTDSLALKESSICTKVCWIWRFLPWMKGAEPKL